MPADRVHRGDKVRTPSGDVGTVTDVTHYQSGKVVACVDVVGRWATKHINVNDLEVVEQYQDPDAGMGEG